jgi:hypothetical protein
MWAALASLALSLFKWVFGGAKQAEGEALGKAEQSNAALSQELNDVQKADAAAGAVSDSPASVRSDPENRDGPNYTGH